MTRVVYVNGSYQPYANAAVHIEDRSVQFADSVYEVIEVYDGCLVDETPHLERLQRSLRELSIPMPMAPRVLQHILRQSIKRNRIKYGIVYLQISRGQGRRNFTGAGQRLEPTLICFARRHDLSEIEKRALDGIHVITTKDIRWQRCDIKTTMLLPACLAKLEAELSNAQEAWLIDDKGLITEGASSNAWIVDQNGQLVTRSTNSRQILAGITRMTTFRAASGEELAVSERAFSREDALNAREAFITSASGRIIPVVAMDGQPIGDGRPGPVTRHLRRAFLTAARLTQ